MTRTRERREPCIDGFQSRRGLKFYVFRDPARGWCKYYPKSNRYIRIFGKGSGSEAIS